MEKAGVKLIAEGADQYFAALNKAAQATAGFGAAAKGSAGDAAAFARAASTISLDKLANTLADQKTRLGILNQQLDATTTKYGESSTQAQTAAARIAKLSGDIDINQKRYGELVGKVNAANNALEEQAKDAACLLYTSPSPRD